MKFIIFGAVAVLILIYFLLTYNELISSRNRVRNQKSQIDIELKRKLDLIPNLVAVVKGHTEHEKSTLEDVIKTRNVCISARNNTAVALGADSALANALSNLFAISESYTELKADAHFLNLQNELSDAEKKIAFSRQFYNDAVSKVNNKIEMFPSNIVAKIFGFSKEVFFDATEAERSNVTFDFKTNCPTCGASCTNHSDRCEYCRSPL